MRRAAAFRLAALGGPRGHGPARVGQPDGTLKTWSRLTRPSLHGWHTDGSGGRCRLARCCVTIEDVTVGFVLGGGGVRGAVQVGMLQALFEAGVRPDTVVGTSIGAINGAALAKDPTPAVVDRL